MLAEPLTIVPELTRQGLIMRVAGDIYLDTAPELREALMRVVASGFYKRVIVDLREIAIMDSSGIAALLNSRKLIPEGVVEMYVWVTLGSQPHRILAAAGLVPHLGVIFNLDKLTDIDD